MVNVHIRFISRIQVDAGVLVIQVDALFDLKIVTTLPEFTEGELICIERLNTHPFAINEVFPVPPAMNVERIV